mmetsp:Transcript_4754/g.17824  ORF Transcript_4754/g.17824 Transcript_4754/m.17824 type:complete len:213 (-) Transcript_4754:1100-1738(-)
MLDHFLLDALDRDTSYCSCAFLRCLEEEFFVSRRRKYHHTKSVTIFCKRFHGCRIVIVLILNFDLWRRCGVDVFTNTRFHLVSQLMSWGKDKPFAERITFPERREIKAPRVVILRRWLHLVPVAHYQFWWLELMSWYSEQILTNIDRPFSNRLFEGGGLLVFETHSSAVGKSVVRLLNQTALQSASQTVSESSLVHQFWNKIENRSVFLFCK